MLINRTNISKFKAILSEKKISACQTNLTVNWNKKALLPSFQDKDTTFCKIDCTLTITIPSGNEDEFEHTFSDLCSIVEDCVLNFDNINLSYKAYISDISTPTRITNWDWEVTFSWIGYKFGDEVIETIDRLTSKTIHVNGNLKAPCIVKIAPVIDMIDVTITGVSEDPIVVRNLKGNKSIIIDGIEGTVLQEGENKFDDTDMWEFPFLIPGQNNITVNKDTCNITIKYNPRFR
ncbi:MAG: phage tail protein [Paeniclostridium sordellii]|nr:phage tail protein [Paeniclostridium sordellii]